MGWKLYMLPVLLVLLAYSWRDTFNPASMQGKRVVITGASTGIGKFVYYVFISYIDFETEQQGLY